MSGIVFLIVFFIAVYLIIGALILSVSIEMGDSVKGWKNKTKFIVGFPFVWLGWLDVYGVE